METWHEIQNIATVPSPALVVYPGRVRENIRLAIQLAGGAERLRPHIKTHKMSAIIRMHLEEGIAKFKCATISEAEMAARAEAGDILLAAQLAGPNLQRFQKLRETFPGTIFSTICDNREVAIALNSLSPTLPVYVDVNCGMNRTGLDPDRAPELHAFIQRQPNLRAVGLHAYDGHVHEVDPAARTEACERSFAPVAELGIQTVIAGGTPTFAIHARYPDRECSPGTYVFWDFGYQRFADLPFKIAALVITRVVSKPAPDRLCVDLGHKAIASENPQPRVQFVNLPDAVPVMHSEEHLVLHTPHASQWKVGDVLYGVPRHICPTVALHDECYPVTNGKAGAPWPIEARRRRITI